MEGGSRTEDKKSLKWFLIKRFLIVMLLILISEELIGLLYDKLVIPWVSLLLRSQHISVTSSGSPVVSILQLLLYILASFLPP